jgi:thiamine-phosphate pyrophosphorylase
MNDPRLYCILDLGYTPEACAEEATGSLLAGGAHLLQLRAKGKDLATIERVARRHIGQDDGPLAAARSLFQSKIQNPKSKILFGRSTHSLGQARAALAEGFDYIGFGPLFPTPTKAGRPAIGLEEIAVMEREVGSQIPAFCIGGITRQTLPQVLAAGARRVVIVSDLLTSSDVQAATREAAAQII